MVGEEFTFIDPELIQFGFSIAIFTGKGRCQFLSSNGLI